MLLSLYGSVLSLPTQIEDKETDTNMEWPPAVETYDSYAKKLDELINMHPPFGLWLKKQKTAIYMLDVQKLKQMYAYEMRMHVRSLYATKYASKHIDIGESQLDQEDVYLAAALKA